jgi:hypothetical protein
MSPEATKAILVRELGIQDLSDVFEWIDLEEPLGSASIAQVGATSREINWSCHLRGCMGGMRMRDKEPEGKE